MQTNQKLLRKTKKITSRTWQEIQKRVHAFIRMAL